MRRLPQATRGYELCVHQADRWTTVKPGRQLPLFVVGMATAILLSCSNPTPKIAATLNESATLSGDLPVNPLKWKIITSVVDKKNSTLSTLYGNDVAVQYARSNAQQAYPEGSKL